MFDIDLPWQVLLPLGPVLLPWAALPGALLAAYACFRRFRSGWLALGAALLGAFAAPWLVMAAAFVLDRASALGPLGEALALVGAVLSSVVVVLVALNRAGSRRRAGR